MPTEVATLTEKQLADLENKVRRGSAAFIEVGQALAKIRDGKGYRLRGFDTFESYCEKEFGISDRHGRRMIQSAETAAEVKKLTGAAPANESVAREFTVLAEKPEQLKRVAEQLEKKGFSVVTATAEAVKEAVQKLAPKPKPALALKGGKAVVLPGMGHPAAKPAPARPLVQDERVTEGVCPRCHEVPDRYDRADEVWVCSACDGVVMLSVRAWPPEVVPPPKGKNGAQGGPQCPHCKKPINPGDPYCQSCGSIL